MCFALASHAYCLVLIGISCLLSCSHWHLMLIVLFFQMWFDCTGISCLLSCSFRRGSKQRMSSDASFPTLR